MYDYTNGITILNETNYSNIDFALNALASTVLGLSINGISVIL